MHTVTFYPVGNGDTSLINLNNGKQILFDFRQNSKSTDENMPEYDVSKALDDELGDKTSFETVAFTHADKDHIEGSTGYFYLEYAKKYQGEGRKKIDELWVPAAMLLESAEKDKQSSEFVIWRQEARYRLKNKFGIKVFSKPGELVALIESWDMSEDELSDFIVDAGTIVDSYSLEEDGVEFFVHSPFMKHVDEEGEDIKKIRNQAALIFNVKFFIENETYNYLAVGDSTWEVLEDIVEITQSKGNEERLKWDLFNIPHHCSYLALSEEKGGRETTPKEKVEELLLQGNKDSYLICSSEPIGSDSEALKQIQPPHLQAKRCYETYLRKVKGRKFIVTMEHESKLKPKPIVIKFEKSGISKKGVVVTAAITTAAAKPARAGVF